jgi:putative ATP-grasp target RiPP
MSAPLLTTETEQPDPLGNSAAALPLGRPFGHVDIAIDAPSTTRPFGLRYAVVPADPIAVDLSALRYDTGQQICVDQTDTPVYGKHSTGPTSTRTSDGHKSMDSDTDHTED